MKNCAVGLLQQRGREYSFGSVNERIDQVEGAAIINTLPDLLRKTVPVHNMIAERNFADLSQLINESISILMGLKKRRAKEAMKDNDRQNMGNLWVASF